MNKKQEKDNPVLLIGETSAECGAGQSAANHIANKMIGGFAIGEILFVGSRPTLSANIARARAEKLNLHFELLKKTVGQMNALVVQSVFDDIQKKKDEIADAERERAWRASQKIKGLKAGFPLSDKNIEALRSIKKKLNQRELTWAQK